ncbi:MAG: hypothetical protein JWR10_431 [Rubritepida sp.]|nr:hypothetical protein [Rubritepida sp.]
MSGVLAVPHDPGGKVKLPMLIGMRGGAEFCGGDGGAGDAYRPILWRRWGAENAPPALFIGMNPSTASGEVDDPTVRREITRCMGWGIKAYVKCNVSDYRATDPKALRYASPLSSARNLPTILDWAARAERVVLAFGALPPPMRLLALDMVAALRANGVRLMCLGLTADLSPRHPLYLRGDAPLVEWPGWREPHVD